MYEEVSLKYDKLNKLRDLLNGDRGKDNSFIDYIAEERLRYVAKRASELLGIMTQYKFALTLDAESGFRIIDNRNGGVSRSVNTLSGGETFLTSLALALALSEQIQLKGKSPLEFFFLDEGFGSLDNELLDLVIDALERISKKERVIGVISHILELRQRIPGRIIVTAPTDNGVGSIVSIEKA
jgi:exonuclease SbcC